MASPSSRHRTARAAAALGVLTLALLAVPGTAAAADRNCSDFTYQEDAQAVLDQDRNDPNGLDSDHDGVACHDLPHRGTAAATDSTGADPVTGSGTTDPGTTDPGTGTDPGAQVLAADPTSTVTTTATTDAATSADSGTTDGTTDGTASSTATTTDSPTCTTTVVTATDTAAPTTTDTATTADTATTTAAETSTTDPSTTAAATETTTVTCSTSGTDSSGSSDGSGSSSSSGDRDCSDFSNQADAQAALDADKNDPNKLDADKDGIACEDRFGTPDQQVQVQPAGGVETGGDPADG